MQTRMKYSKTSQVVQMALNINSATPTGYTQDRMIGSIDVDWSGGTAPYIRFSWNGPSSGMAPSVNPCYIQHNAFDFWYIHHYCHQMIMALLQQNTATIDYLPVTKNRRPWWSNVFIQQYNQQLMQPTQVTLFRFVLEHTQKLSISTRP